MTSQGFNAHDEIERKFLVKNFPEGLVNWPETLKINILQGYYFNGDKVIRLRRSETTKIAMGLGHYRDVSFVKCYKEGIGVKRVEHEETITEEEFKALWFNVRSWQLSKTRYLVSLNDGHVAELDRYDSGQMKGLWTVEVEFKTVKEADFFVVPEWFGEDVTGDEDYANSNLAKYGGLKSQLESEA